jgi:hypothetical protein
MSNDLNFNMYVKLQKDTKLQDKSDPVTDTSTKPAGSASTSKMIAALSMRAMSQSIEIMARAIDRDGRGGNSVQSDPNKTNSRGPGDDPDLHQRVSSLETVVGEVHHDIKAMRSDFQQLLASLRGSPD